jgi:hypothetical protein
MIYTFVPYKDKNESFRDTCNNFMKLIPNEEDFGIILDHDVMFTTHFWYKQVSKCVEENPDVNAFTAVTNRIYSKYLWADVDKDNNDVGYHRNMGNKIAEQFGSEVTDISDTDEHNRGWGGYFMMLRKKTWTEIGGFADKSKNFKGGGMDWGTHEVLADKGEKILLMNGVYVYHWYSNFNPENYAKGMRRPSRHIKGLF